MVYIKFFNELRVVNINAPSKKRLAEEDRTFQRHTKSIEEVSKAIDEFEYIVKDNGIKVSKQTNRRNGDYFISFIFQKFPISELDEGSIEEFIDRVSEKLKCKIERRKENRFMCKIYY